MAPWIVRALHRKICPRGDKKYIHTVNVAIPVVGIAGGCGVDAGLNIWCGTSQPFHGLTSNRDCEWNFHTSYSPGSAPPVHREVFSVRTFTGPSEATHLAGPSERHWAHLKTTRPSEVQMRHVRSHIGVPGNETADYLADLRWGAGQRGQAVLTAAQRWLTRWFERGKIAAGDG